MITPDNKKRCRHCRELLPVSDFGPAKRGDGYRSWCKACTAADARKRWVDSNPDAVARHNKRSRLRWADPVRARRDPPCSCCGFLAPAVDPVLVWDMIESEWHEYLSAPSHGDRSEAAAGLARMVRHLMIYGEYRHPLTTYRGARLCRECLMDADRKGATK